MDEEKGSTQRSLRRKLISALRKLSVPPQTPLRSKLMGNRKEEVKGTCKNGGRRTIHRKYYEKVGFGSLKRKDIERGGVH